MNKDKMIQLNTYASKMKALLSETSVPKKHVGRESQYKAFLTRELSAVLRQIDELRFGDAPKGK